MEELRFTDNVVGVFALSKELEVARSGWLCCDGSGGKELRMWLSFSRGLGSSDMGGRWGNNVAFRYSLPRGVSRDCTCHLD